MMAAINLTPNNSPPVQLLALPHSSGASGGAAKDNTSSSYCRLVRWSVREGDRVHKGTVLCTYTYALIPHSDDGIGDASMSTEPDISSSDTGSSSVSRPAPQHQPALLSLKSNLVGVVLERLAEEGSVVPPGYVCRLNFPPPG